MDRSDWRKQTAFITILVIVYTSSSFWLSLVNQYVPHPYLDEIFHVPQAQAYLAGQWYIWDPSITTPPGLYLFSYLKNWAAELAGKPSSSSTADIRSSNLSAYPLLLYAVFKLLEEFRPGDDRSATGEKSRQVAHLATTSLNICLFPVIFFFTGLYYTDIVAVISFLLLYLLDQKSNGRGLSRDLGGILFLPLVGALSLLCRQTNIFWAVIFLGGMQIVITVRAKSRGTHGKTVRGVIWRGWKFGEVYDSLVEEAYLEGEKACPVSKLSR